MQDAAGFEGKRDVFDNLKTNANFLFDIIPSNVKGLTKIRMQMDKVSNLGSRLIGYVSNSDNYFNISSKVVKSNLILPINQVTDYSEHVLKIVNKQAEVLYAKEVTNNTKKYIDKIKSTTENFTKEHELYEQAMADNQHDYEIAMNQMGRDAAKMRAGLACFQRWSENL